MSINTDFHKFVCADDQAFGRSVGDTKEEILSSRVTTFDETTYLKKVMKTRDLEAMESL